MICGKKIYVSQTEAVHAATGTNRDKRPGHKSHNRLAAPYFCDDCNGWHNTSKSFRRMKKQKKDEDVRSLQKESKKALRSFNGGFLIIRNYTGKPILCSHC